MTYIAVFILGAATGALAVIAWALREAEKADQNRKTDPGCRFDCKMCSFPECTPRDKQRIRKLMEGKR